MIGEKDFWGRGYGTEALKLVVNYAFNRLNLHKIYAGINSSNKASIRAYQKVGFKVEGRKREERYIDGRYHDTMIMGLISNEYQGS